MEGWDSNQSLENEVQLNIETMMQRTEPVALIEQLLMTVWKMTGNLDKVTVADLKMSILPYLKLEVC